MLDNASQLRAAIERGEFAHARELWEQWFADLEERLAAGTLDPAEWARTEAVFRWSQGVLLAERAHLLHRLNTLHAAGKYGPARAPLSATFIQGTY